MARLRVRAAVLAALWLGAPAAAQDESPPASVEAPAARKPRRRPRYRKAGAPERPRYRLRGGAWTPEARRALETLIFERGRESPAYSAETPPAAVLSLDDAAAFRHAGEAVFHRLVTEAEFKFSKGFWDTVPYPHAERARRAHARFTALPQSVWAKDPDYQTYRKGMFQAYDELCRSRGRRTCRSWLLSLLQGFGDGEAEQYMRLAVEGAFAAPAEDEIVEAYAGDAKPLAVRRGLRRIPDVEALARELLAQGFDVWAVSSSNQWAAEAVAERYGIDRTRVVGGRCRILNKRLRDEVVEPFPEGVGKAEATSEFIAQDPALIIAAAFERELLTFGKGLRIALDAGDPIHAEDARRVGVLVQPLPPPGPPELAP